MDADILAFPVVHLTKRTNQTVPQESSTGKKKKCSIAFIGMATF